MTIFNDKTEFFEYGVELIMPSPYQVYENCKVCLEPIATSTIDHASESRMHAAVRIKSCKHIHGTECLGAWLDIGNSCPTCKRTLIMHATERPLTQEDVDDVSQVLRYVCDEETLGRALARYMYIDEAAAIKRRQKQESGIAMERVKQEENENKEREETMLNEEDFMDDEEEGMFDEDEGYDEDVGIVSDEE
ncbi:hypothetical protein BU23DRAFT_575843 [Bimuria novae-zelandiae CBS 107.79]|uniref:RING-type domain-containing protein n=1 Tax=Bimuria novae-zelandiae CBS 107.79 TaxID=1447943 RepID=A0A6A5UGC4_9PLEO|nr:hypothetical protein BU23DRAFT_575843 [Bimuria novae-zelandiae CBS 107.79]